MISFLALPLATTSSGLVTALASLITALSLILTAIGVLIPILRDTRKNTAQITEVHAIVDGQRTDMRRYNVALVGALNDAGVDVPVDQSLAAIPTPPPNLTK